MKTNNDIYTRLSIDIITFKTDYKTEKINNMNAAHLDKKKSQNANKFICSICLNQKPSDDIKGSEVGERKSKSCPICQCSHSYTDDESTHTKRTGLSNSNITSDKDQRITQEVQTTQAVAEGLTLLNEVLNVFQSKKQLSNHKSKPKTRIFRDIGVSTEHNSVNLKPKLSMSKIFQYSIVDNRDNGNKFTILTSSQPDTIFESRKCIDLIKHKSSSIPQMKLEELKNSLKEKTKSKDAIEEANRMFANVKREEDKDILDNRPVVRCGPRVLPVVKTNYVEANYVEDNCTKSGENPKFIPKSDQICKHCNENNFYLSSGDSSMKPHCHNSKYEERCEDCVHMLCCRHKQNRLRSNELVCKRCRAVKQEN